MAKKSTFAFRLASVFTDHMVLQRGTAVPVWGRAAPGAVITVEAAGHTVRTVTQADGTWMAKLPSLPTGGPIALRAGDGRNAIVLKDVMVGEVWVCGGQSNMEWPLQSAPSHPREIDEADHAGIRLLFMPRRAELHPPPEIDCQWRRCTPQTAATFSAVAYFFGREIHRRTGVPVGLISASWNGCVAEAFVSRPALAADPLFAGELAAYDREVRNSGALGRKFLTLQRQWDKRYAHRDTRNVGYARGWHKPELACGDWPTMDLPRNWQSAGHNHSGIFWFRREVDVPAAWRGKQLTLSLGAIDKSDVTYFNGVQVGSLTMEQRSDAWCTPRTYQIPRDLVRPGRNVIAVRVYSNVFHGGFIGQPLQMKLFVTDDPDRSVALAGPWRYQIEANFGLVPPPPTRPRGNGNPNSPHILFDNLIRPLLPLPIRGAIWYQGEANVGRAEQYKSLFPLLIRSWRDAWQQGDFPFLFAQLANYGHRASRPGRSHWAELREAQMKALALPNTAMAVTVDIGDPSDIHPRNKKDVGLRLALPALRSVHGFSELVTSGPLYRSAQVEKGRIRIFFDHVAGGLVSRGPLDGFEIAGKNRKFVPAQARIDGNTVLVWHPAIRNPVAVRYAWQDNPPSPLYNTSELPASPFRTDDWPCDERR